MTAATVPWRAVLRRAREVVRERPVTLRARVLQRLSVAPLAGLYTAAVLTATMEVAEIAEVRAALDVLLTEGWIEVDPERAIAALAFAAREPSDRERVIYAVQTLRVLSDCCRPLRRGDRVRVRAETAPGESYPATVVSVDEAGQVCAQTPAGVAVLCSLADVFGAVEREEERARLSWLADSLERRECDAIEAHAALVAHAAKSEERGNGAARKEAEK